MRELIVPSLVAATLVLGCTADVPTDATPDASSAAITHAHGTPSAQKSAQVNKDLARLRSLIAPLHNPDKAIAAGYETDITGCLDDAVLGGMGHHYTRGDFSLIADGVIDPWQPEILVYAPQKNGKLKLAAVEYVIPYALSPEPPVLFGETFHRNDAIGAWILHVWIWWNNPAGMFSDFNPAVPLCES